MKKIINTSKLLFALFAMLLSTSLVVAQDLSNKPTIAVLNIDTPGLDVAPRALGSITRTELNKLGKFQVLDIYDVDYMIEQNGFSIDNCYGKICMVEAGNILKVDKMLTGSAELLGEYIVITMRLIDVKTGSIEKTQVVEFITVEEKIPVMVNIVISKMFGISLDENIVNKLTKPYDYESSVNNPDAETLNLSGPRMGMTVMTGELAQIYKSPLQQGGFDAYPMMFQFGYQFEVKYLNHGDFQALFEIIPMVTGLDQGKFIPSISVLNGMRSNKTGWEFAFGPIVYALKEADGYIDESGDWKLVEEYEGVEENPNIIETKIDSRGNLALESAFVFGVGKTFKSGRLNIPVNGFFIPGKSGNRFGISMGFNASRYK